ncbi:probable syntaxin, vesicular transport protein [Pseudozyma flocculosa]|uniref:Probable syntaxin, vesicular transport protein n=1 Tax=Pseudozyma flocculosa TaxID=84751 RepID=A0A5C3F9F0_9BASI|nr:probable syntaxin, vesicular transport protein [Pseudozyma flocculosa]
MSYTPTSYYGHTVKDRTAEFHSCVESIASRSATAGSAGPASASRQRLLNSGGASQPASGSAKGEFAKRAQAISKDIASTTNKLQRLAQLARRKTLFDDRPVEISELTYIIKHDIAAINKQLADLQAFNKAQRGSGRAGTADRAEEHRGNVVTLLQSKLAGATTSFQDILEIRTQNIKASKDRTDQFMFGGSGAAASGGGAGAANGSFAEGFGENSVLRARSKPATAPFSGSGAAATLGAGVGSDSPLYNPTRTGSAMAHRSIPQQGRPGQSDDQYDSYDPKGKGKATSGGDGDFLALDMGSGGGGGSGPGGGDQFMQMQLMEQRQDNYLATRSTAIESIESTISELGQIFSQLAHMVAEQRETVQRIDDNVMEVVDNVGGAQRELLKYYQSVSSNRWLMLKIFGVLIVFFLLFILVS